MRSSRMEQFARIAAATLRKARKALRPLRRPYGAVRDRLSRAVFDRGNVDTSRHVSLAELELDVPGRNDYEPSGWRFGRRMLRHYRVTNEDVFCDFGSGMGRVALMIARRYPFGRVIGVEISPELDRIARENVRRNRGRLKAREVELLCLDALEFQIPDDLTYAYFYNPFGGEIFERIVARLIASIDRRPRRLVILYAHPLMHDVLMSTGRFVHVRTSIGLRPDIPNYRIHTYENL